MIERLAAVRADKFLWVVRLFKTRTLAAEACEKGVVRVGGQTVKPSRMFKVGEVFTLRRPPVLFTYKVLALGTSRLPASRVAEFLADQTPPEELAKREILAIEAFAVRDRGAGRPTKRERRDLDRLHDEI